MEVLKVTGGARLQGTTAVYGAKNAVLPIMAAALLVDGTVVLHNVPDLTDVDAMCRILRLFHCTVKREDDTVVIDTAQVQGCDLPETLTKKMRASNLVWGPLIGRFGRAILPLPGGCMIGSRPMDYHIKGMRQLGIAVEERAGQIVSCTTRLVGANICLDFPSVGATENLIMAAVKAEGTTVLRNVAKEPEVADLCHFLCAAGAKIGGIGSDLLTIEGVKHLGSLEYRVIPDRIVGGTLLLAAAACGGDVTVCDTVPEHLEAVLAKMTESGVTVERRGRDLRVRAGGRRRPCDIKTMPYPGFPTDIQPQFMAYLTTVRGTSVVCESIFENRFNHCDELRRMGADIRVEGRIAIIEGVRRLEGAEVEAEDLRGGAALLLAGLAAEGETTLRGVRHIDRGYRCIEGMFRELGAQVERAPLA